MVYSFQLWKHPNIRYRDALLRLSRCELLCMLRTLSIETDLQLEELGSAPFFTFSCRELSEYELTYLVGHSCVTFLTEKHGNMLHPLPVSSGDLFPPDLPEIMKYKGKTNPSFTRMMLNAGLALTSFSHQEAVTVLDPLCGRGTTLFAALCMGVDAVGIDTDRRDLKEASDYFSRYLKSSGWKHSSRDFSSTVSGVPVPGLSYEFARDKAAWQSGDTHKLTFHQGDTSLAFPLMRKSPAHLLVTDLPYGIQHAPQGGASPESFSGFLRRVLPSWRKALRPGAAAVISFNALTLKASVLREALTCAGFQVAEDPVFSNLSHTVEQAVVRDLVFAFVP